MQRDELDLLDVLRDQRQCDEEGVMCIVSRQAVDETIAELTRLRAQVAASGAWQPMDSCPKDETVVMIHVPGRLLPYWSRGDDYWGGFAHWLTNATHWQPLPASPQPQQDEGVGRGQ